MSDQLFDSSKRGLKIAIVAGEASGDLLGAALIKALRVRFPDAQFAGVAGPKMIAAGALTIEPMETLAVGGVVEVLRHLPKLFRLRSRLVSACRRERPDIFIGIDAPDFNLGLALRVKRLGVQTVHYVSPSVWAWRPERIKGIRKAVSHMLLLLPFEKAIYEKAGIPASYVGHPLADQMGIAADVLALRDLLNIPVGKKVLAILPGSRQREVEALAPLFVATAAKLSENHPGLVLLVPMISRETRQIFETEIWKQGVQDLPWRLMFGHSHEAMQAADVILLASGTAALEAMLAKRPVVVAYTLAPLTYYLVKRKFLLPYVSLPNIISGRFLVPEFLQDEARVENLVQTLNVYLVDKELRREMADEFTRLHESLRCNAAERAADAICGVLGKS